MRHATRLSVTAVALAAAWLAGAQGRTYDVTEPLWNQPYTIPPAAVITGVEPASAPPGVNTILITGQNLSSVPVTNGVFFDNTAAEVVSKTSGSITVRRPALVAEACTIKVVPDSTLGVAKAGFGRIDPVTARIGDFRDNIALATVTVDSVENLFVASGVSPVTVWKVLPDGSKTALTTSGSFLRPPFDASIRGDVLLFAGNNREIQQLNLTSGVVSRWTQMPPGKIVRTGSFDATGYYYTGGVIGAGLCVVPPNPPATLTLAQIAVIDAYTAEEVLLVRVLGSSLLVASRSGTGAPVSVWRHSLATPGQPAPRELLVDLGAYPWAAARAVTGISLSANGVWYLTTDAVDPLLTFTPGGGLDYFYRGIIPPNGRHASWGNGNQLYLVIGDVTNSDTGLRWNIVDVSMGQQGE
jgi:hypothetical protein